MPEPLSFDCVLLALPSAESAITNNIVHYRAGQSPPGQVPLGDTIHGQVSGWLAGKASYSFTASALPSTKKNAGVPGSETGAPVTAAQTTSDWYEQAFPAGTTFGGAGIHWVKIAVYSQQHWTDSLAGDGGQLKADGNITGVC